MKKKVIILSVIILIVSIFVLFFTTSKNYFTATIVSNSMSPTLLPKDKVLVEKTSEINTGDIIAYSIPISQNKLVQIHRVIAKGGETISFKKIAENKYVVLINGKELNEQYLEKDCKYFAIDDSLYATQTIPPNHYYVLGDNRLNANDSRFIGYINNSDIKGKIIKIISSKH